MSGILGTLGGVQSGGSQTRCATPVITPDGGDPGVTAAITDSTTGAHLFYTISHDVAVTPTHNGDNPTGTTQRIGSNNGSVGIPGSINHSTVLSVLAYQLGLTDSAV